MLTQVWEDAGKEAEVVFLLQQIEMVLQQAATIPSHLHLKRIKAIDGNDASSLINLVALYPKVVKQFLEQVDDILGIDVLTTLKSSGTQS